jgi:uncharacterized protein (UPF0333 family)
MEDYIMELLLSALVLVLGFVVSGVILTNAFKEDNHKTNVTTVRIENVGNVRINSTDEFAVNHIDNYTVESVRYIRDTNGNWRTVSVDYKRI